MKAVKEFSEDKAFNFIDDLQVYVESINNFEHSYSWFRDQVFPPCLTQHIYEDFFVWCQDLFFKVFSTSINNYSNIEKFKKEELFKLQLKLEEYSYKQNAEKLEFNPSFFHMFKKK